MTLFEKKGDGVLRQRNPVKYAFIKRHCHRYSIGLMCQLLGISRNGYYHYLTHGKRKEDKKLVLSIKAVFRASRQTYGTRRIREALRREYGLIVSRRRIGRIMQKEGLVAKRKGRKRIKTTDSNHNLPISPNLLERRFIGLKPNQVYVGDITYIKTKEGWLYLAVVIDLYARVVVGQAIADHMQKELVIKALKHAHARRGGFEPKAIFHSDRGSQYASFEFRKTLEAFDMRQSMSAKGNCYDNAACETFFATLKTELPGSTKHLTKKEAIKAIENYITFYNIKRLHSYNGYLSPLEAEMVWWRNRLKVAA